MFALLIAAPFALFTTVPFSVPVEDVVVVFFVVVGFVVVTAVVVTLSVVVSVVASVVTSTSASAERRFTFIVISLSFSTSAPQATL